jgi:hypothetical protein
MDTAARRQCLTKTAASDMPFTIGQQLQAHGQEAPTKPLGIAAAD